MILLDPKGLLWGKRLRKLSLKSRLYYPLILGLTNFYARIELDTDVILSQFTSFKDPELTSENLARWFDEYRHAGLAFLYNPTATQTWVQFDTPVAMRRDYPTTGDNRSPVPPEADYANWLRSIHGERWNDYNLNQYQQTIAEKRAEAGRKGGMASGQTRRSKTNGAPASEPVDGDVAGVGVVDGVGAVAIAVGGEESSIYLANEPTSYNNLSSSYLSQSGTGEREPDFSDEEEPVCFCNNPQCPAPGNCDHCFRRLITQLLAYQLGLEEIPVTWPADAKSIAAPDRATQKYIEGLILWAYGRSEDSFWRDRTANMKAFVTHVNKGGITRQFDEALSKPETYARIYTINPDGCPFPHSICSFVPISDEMKHEVIRIYGCKFSA